MSLPTQTEAAEAVAEYVDEDTEQVPEDVTSAAAAGRAMVARFLGTSGVAAIPAEIALQAVTEAGAAVYYRRSARNGIVGLGGIDVQPIRISKDSLSTVYSYLLPYAPPGFA